MSDRPLLASSTPANVTPFPLAQPGADACDPKGGPPAVITPGASQLGTDQIAVPALTNGQPIPTRLTGVQANARLRTVTNQGDGLGGGSDVFVTGPTQRGGALGNGVRIPVGAGRDFRYTGELWAISSPTGVPAGGNIVDVQTEFDG